MDYITFIYFLEEQRRKGITNSLLLPSGTLIAEIFVNEFNAYIIVHGSVRIIYKDEVYKDISQFPEELVDIIRNGNLGENADTYLDMNNWYELVVLKNEREIYCDVVDIDISTMTETDMQNFLLDSIQKAK